MYIQIVIFLLFQISHAYKTNPTPWFCTDPHALDSAVEISQKLPSCRPGHVIDIEDVVYESTVDGKCSGKSLCSLHNKNALLFACNQKQICNVEIRHFRFHINSTCGSTVRFFTKYRCLPVIQEQKDYLCESSIRRPSLADIKLSCERYYRLHVTLALVGISVKQQDNGIQQHFKCNKDTYWLCNHYVPDAYRNACSNQLDRGIGDYCDIRPNDRPRLKGCQYGEVSNFSLVEYSCIPGEGITDDLPRIDICSNEATEQISLTHGLLHSPNYPHPVGKYLSCKKQLHISRESRLRLFMLEKSIEYYHELNIRLLNTEPNSQRTLAKNELFDKNLTNQQNNEIVEIELKTNHVGGGNFLLYFQVDSRISEYAPSILEANRKTTDNNRRHKPLVKRDWGIVIGCIIGLLLVVCLIGTVLIIVKISKRRRAESLKYLKSDDDHRQHLNASSPDYHHRPKKTIQIEHPHLLSSSPTIISSLPNTNHRTNISSSSIVNDSTSDRESLLKQSSRINTTSTNNDNFYEEIKDHQQAINLDLGNNHYLEPKSFEDRRKFFEDTKSSSPIRDHRESEQGLRRPAPLATPEHGKRHLASVICDAPMASTETLNVGSNLMRTEQMKRPKQPPPKIPPPRMDLDHPKPSAPPLDLLQNDNFSEDIRPQHRLRQMQHPNNNKYNA
ncbi:unnamed protein product [Adineta steineri]|uniref:SUEL-type lectin domain-containing protein n=1 Tax=Adineta steineri TaxID=433720 RepID=A0A816CXZ7_9BILA|nr:unnamed protein product [Adineta steineri]CAF1630047.1 unnamed protein product [Adineta steineri]